MLKKHIYFGFLLTFSLLLLQCNNDAATSKTVSEVSTEVASKAKETTAALKEATQEAQKTVQDVAKSAKEATPSLTKAKEAVEETATKSVAKAKEVALKTKEKVVKKKEEVKKKTVKKKKKKKKRSKIKFGNTNHEFGTIKQGDIVKYDFNFKNSGDAPLVIKKVDVSCGCTFPSYPFMPIEPGKSGTIGITYDSKNKMGRQKPTITVVTNGRPSTVKLNLEGTVQ